VNAARCKALEERGLGRFLINMEWLRIKRCGKRNDFISRDRTTAALESLTWREIVQPQQ